MGFFVLDPDSGAVVSQFQHVFPASIAIGHGLDRSDRRAARDRVLGRPRRAGRLFPGRAAVRTARGRGAAAALLRCTSSRSGSRAIRTSTSCMQALLFAALLANARAQVDDDPFFAPVAGVLLGAAAVPALRRGRRGLGDAGRALALGLRLGAARPRWTFLAPLAVGCALCAWYLTGPMRRVRRTCRSCSCRTCRSGSTRRLAIAAAAGVAAHDRRKALAGGLGARVNGVHAAGAHGPRRRCGDLRVVLPAPRRPVDRLRRVLAADLRRASTSRCRRFIAAMVGYAVVARSLFWRDPAFFLTLTAFSLLLLLQDPDRAGAFLGGAPFRADHPARHAAARCRRRR